MKPSVASSGKWLLLAALASLLLAGFFWQNLIFASAVATSEYRPALLRDAVWGEPVSSFRERFNSGTPEAELLLWLAETGFKIASNGSAYRRLRGLPCNELVEVSWTAVDGEIRDSSAVVLKAGCL